MELMTLIVALAGATLGASLGGLCGVVAATAYSLGSPLGLPVPLLLLGQALGMGAAGILGGTLGRLVVRTRRGEAKLVTVLGAVGLGLACTVIYDLLTNLAIVGAFEMNLWVVLAGAVPFALLHAGVNGLVFGLLFPTLGVRLKGLGQAPLSGRGAVLIWATLLCGMLYADTSWAQPQRSRPPGKPPRSSAPVDTLKIPVTSPEDDLEPRTVSPSGTTGPAAAFGWQRPLWEPYAKTIVQELDWRSSYLPVTAGGLGAPVFLAGEGCVTGNPTFLRDGVPLGTGHALLDDPWLIPNQGLDVAGISLGPSLSAGTDGAVSLVSADTAPDRAVSLYRGSKGPHETYHRGFSLSTPRAAWRLAFLFDESLDKEGFNTTADPDEIFADGEEFRGHAMVRSSSTRLTRQLDPVSRLTLEYHTGRKTRDDLPVWGVDHQEIWSAGGAATMESRLSSWRWRAILHAEQRDTRFGDRPTAAGPASDARLIETSRQGLVLDWVFDPVAADSLGRVRAFRNFRWPDLSYRPGQTGFGLRYAQGAVADSGATWLPDLTFPTRGEVESLHLVAHTGRPLGSSVLAAAITLDTGSHGGIQPGGELSVSSVGSSTRWKLGLTRSVRVPRSDELWTPWRRIVNDRTLFVLPNSHLDPEQTLRAQATGGLSLAGFDLALDASLRRLDQGISWVSTGGDADIGTWQNGLKMDASRLTGTLGRQGRFLGWARVRLESTWQKFDITEGTAWRLPPENYLRLEMRWENHFFQEDGILQLALLSTRRGEMSDPWDPSGLSRLSSATWHDLVLGFRLVGAHISFAFRNLTSARYATSASTLAPGREMDMRLRWVFHY